MRNRSKGSSSSNNSIVPSSLKFISSCIKTASSGVRSATASISSSLSGDNKGHKEQVLWASFDRLELNKSSSKKVLLIGYSNGFQVIDVEDSPNVVELVSRRDDPVTFLQIQPFLVPSKSREGGGFRESHPLLLIVMCDGTKDCGVMIRRKAGWIKEVISDPQTGNLSTSSVVRFYSLRSHSYVHFLRFRSAVLMVRCSSQIVAVGLATQIYCFDAATLENKFSVLTYPVPQLGNGVINIGYGPMAVGQRWLAYASNNPLVSTSGRLSPQSVSPLGVSPSSSPGSGTMMARYAMESGKHLAAGIVNFGEIGYKTLSRYCQDIMPDGSSSPISSNSSWKVGRAAASHSSETDTAGTVVVKDFVSRAVISQFRAHTSPISALCFDPSGTLLVTASTHGNNINIFRIMPSHFPCESGVSSYDWSCSHVHLYKLHRGITSAVIQDICFSHYSQWIAIVSSRGTCHIFALSPFGGENVFQIQDSLANGPILSPVLSLPWWQTPSFTISQPSAASPPSPTTLSVVSRIKGNSGWLNTVSSVASSASASERFSVPPGAIAAAFHNCVHEDEQPSCSRKAVALEHLLVYTPCGHVIQYNLVSSVGEDPTDSSPKTTSDCAVEVRLEELEVDAKPVRWWDVCRKVDWPEREQPICGIALNGYEPMVVLAEAHGIEKDKKSYESSHLYLSNAEVQGSSRRAPLWEKSKILFYTIVCPSTGTEKQTGEIEVEMLPFREIEITRKDLMPVFDHFYRTSHMNLGETNGTVYSSRDSHGTRLLEDGAPSHPKRAIPHAIANPNCERGGISVLSSSILYKCSANAYMDSFSFSKAQVLSVNSNAPSSEIASISASHTVAENIYSSKNGSMRETLSGNCNFNESRLKVKQFFEEGYCNPSCLVPNYDSTEVITLVDSNENSPYDMEQAEEDVDDDHILGAVFPFSEDG